MPEALEIKVNLTAQDAERTLEKLQASLVGVSAAAAKTDAALTATGAAVGTMTAGTSAASSAAASLSAYLAELGGVSAAAAGGVDALVKAAVASTGGLGQLGAVTAVEGTALERLGASAVMASGGLGQIGAAVGMVTPELVLSAEAASAAAAGFGALGATAAGAAGGVGSLGAAAVVASGGLGKLGATITATETGTAAAAAGVGLMGGAVGGLVAAATGYLTIQKLFSAIGEADKAYDMAAAFDMSASRLIVLTNAARQFGAESSDLIMAFRGLSQSMQDALADPESTAADRFREIKLSAEELARVPLDEAFLQVADGLSKIENTSTRTAVALDVLHVRNANLLAMMRGGRKDIEAAADEIERIGTVSDENSAAADRFGDSINRLKGGFTAFAAGLAPAMAEIAESIEGLIGKSDRLLDRLTTSLNEWTRQRAGIMSDADARLTQTSLQERLTALPVDRARELARQAGRTFEGGVLSRPAADINSGDLATQAFLITKQNETLADLIDAEEKRAKATGETTDGLAKQVDVLDEIHRRAASLALPPIPLHIEYGQQPWDRLQADARNAADDLTRMLEIPEIELKLQGAGQLEEVRSAVEKLSDEFALPDLKVQIEDVERLTELRALLDTVAAAVDLPPVRLQLEGTGEIENAKEAVASLRQLLNLPRVALTFNTDQIADVKSEVDALIESIGLPELVMKLDIDTEPVELKAEIAGEMAAAAMARGFRAQWEMDRLNLMDLGLQGPAGIREGLPQGMPAISAITGKEIKDDEEKKAKAGKQVDQLAESIDALGNIANATRTTIDDLILAMVDFVRSLPKLLSGLSAAAGGAGGTASAVGGTIESTADAVGGLERLASSTAKVSREFDKLPEQVDAIGKTTVFGEPVQQGASLLSRIGGTLGTVAQTVGQVAGVFLPVVGILGAITAGSRARQARERGEFFSEFERQLSSGGPLLEAAATGGLTWRTQGGGQTMTLSPNASTEDIRRFGNTERLIIHINALDSRSVSDFFTSERTRDSLVRAQAFTHSTRGY